MRVGSKSAEPTP